MLTYNSVWPIKGSLRVRKTRGDMASFISVKLLRISNESLAKCPPCKLMVLGTPSSLFIFINNKKKAIPLQSKNGQCLTWKHQWTFSNKSIDKFKSKFKLSFQIYMIKSSFKSHKKIVGNVRTIELGGHQSTNHDLQRIRLIEIFKTCFRKLMIELTFNGWNKKTKQKSVWPFETFLKIEWISHQSTK